MRDTGPVIWSASWSVTQENHCPPEVDALLARLPGWTVRKGPGWVIAANRPEAIAEVGDWIIACPTGQLIDRSRRTLMSPAEACAALTRGGTDSLNDLAPPFRLIAINRQANRPSAYFDQFGLGHMFEGRNADTLFTSTSARLVAQAIGTGPDIGALVSYSQLGVFAFAATPYLGVSKLLPPDPWATRYASVGSGRSVEALHQDVETTFRDAVQTLLAAAPSAALEISGGLDSRLILAAMTSEQRAGRSALTLGSPGAISADRRIASKLAKDYRLTHKISQPAANPWQDPEVLFGTLADACAGYQGMGNPVDKSTLLANGEDNAELARFGGQNGEILRGFYHAMQPLGVAASNNLWTALVDWRLTANDKVQRRLLSQHAYDDVIPSQRKAFLALLGNFDGEWGQVLDRLYLRLRMQAWVGNAASSSLVKRTMLMPFFDPDFVSAAMALPPQSRSKSMAAYRLLRDIDPALAAVPLDSGRTPASFLEAGLGARLGTLRSTAGKLARKMVQRLRPRSGSALGSAAVVEAWHHHRGAERLDFGRLEKLGIFDPAMLEALQSGQITPDRNELGFLLICDNL